MHKAALCLFGILMTQLIFAQNSRSNLDSIKAIPFNEYISDFDLYSKVFQDGLKMAKTLQMPVAQAELSRKMGVIHYLKGNYEKSAGYMLDAITLSDSLKDSSGLAKNYSLLGFQLKAQNLDLGIDYMRKAIQIQELLKDSIELCSSYDNYGVLLELQDHLDSANFYYHRALEIKTLLQDSVGIPFSLNKIAQIERLRGAYRLALEKAIESTKIRENLGQDIYLAENYFLIGEIYRDWQKTRDAITYFKRALEKSNSSNYPYLIRNSSRELYLLYKSQQQYDLALEHNEIYTSYKDSIDNVEQRKNREALLQKFESEKKERQIAEQRVAISKAQLQSKNRLIAIFTLSTILVLILAFAYNIIKALRAKKRKAEAEIKHKIQEERLRLSRDLHDHLGAELAIISGEIQQISANTKATNIRQDLVKIDSYAQQAMQVLRETIWAMNSHSIKMQEFILRYRRYKDKFCAAYSITPSYSFEGNYPDAELNSSRVIHLFRICQEAIANSCKHSNTQNISTQLRFNRNTIQMIIRDFGVGFNSGDKNQHSGIQNMRVRAQEAQIELKISSSISGTEIEMLFSV